MRLRRGRAPWLAAFLIAGLLAPALASAGTVHAQCVGDDVTVDCTGIDPDGYRPTVGSDPNLALNLTVHDGALVNNPILVNDNDTVTIQAGGTVTPANRQYVVGVRGLGNNITVVNTGTVNATANIVFEGEAEGIILNGRNPQIINSGTITADSTGELGYSMGIVANAWDTGSVTNSGSITSTTVDGEMANGIYAAGTVQITNSGTITVTSTTILSPGALANGIVVLNGPGTQVTNSGTITVDDARFSGGISVSGGSGVITNTGTITAHDAAIWGDTSSQVVTNSGTLNGDVLLGPDNDSFTAEGGAVNGTLDGGDDFDTLTFAFDVLDVDYPALAALIAAASPAGGSLAYGGATYTWLNFEQLINLLNIVASNGGGEVIVSTGGIDDGRLNRLHPAATAIVYPLADGGVELYTPQGNFVLRAAADAVIAALAQAEASNAPVEISARLGLALLAQPDGSLLATGPSYTFTFSPADCGLAS